MGNVWWSGLDFEVFDFVFFIVLFCFFWFWKKLKVSDGVMN